MVKGNIEVTSLHPGRTAVCSGHNVPRETGEVRGEAPRDALVPDPFDESCISEGSRALPMVPLCAA